QQLSIKAQARFQQVLKSAVASATEPQCGAQQLSIKAQARFQQVLKSAAASAAQPRFTMGLTAENKR
ncbi:hypothetical protein, partial [Ottowia beijingensis]